MPRAQFNLVLSPWLGLETARHLEQKYGQPFLHEPAIPIGARLTGGFLRRVASFAGLAPEPRRGLHRPRGARLLPLPARLLRLLRRLHQPVFAALAVRGHRRKRLYARRGPLPRRSARPRARRADRDGEPAGDRTRRHPRAIPRTRRRRERRCGVRRGRFSRAQAGARNRFHRSLPDCVRLDMGRRAGRRSSARRWSRSRTRQPTRWCCRGPMWAIAARSRCWSGPIQRWCGRVRLRKSVQPLSARSHATHPELWSTSNLSLDPRMMCQYANGRLRLGGLLIRYRRV